MFSGGLLGDQADWYITELCGNYAPYSVTVSCAIEFDRLQSQLATALVKNILVYYYLEWAGNSTVRAYLCDNTRKRPLRDFNSMTGFIPHKTLGVMSDPTTSNQSSYLREENYP